MDTPSEACKVAAKCVQCDKITPAYEFPNGEIKCIGKTDVCPCDEPDLRRIEADLSDE